MAKKKKSKGSRRRRVGALSPSSPIVKIGAVALGYLLVAKPVNDMIDKAVNGKVDSKIIGAGTTGIGALLLLSKRPSIIKSVGGGLAAGIGLRRLKEALMPSTTPVVTGYGAVPVVGGFRSVPVIGSGYSPAGTLGGGYKVGRRAGKVMGSIDGSGLMSRD